MQRRTFFKSAATGLAAATGLEAALGNETPTNASPPHDAGRGPAWLAQGYQIVEQAPRNQDQGPPEVYFMAMGLAQMPSGRLVAATSRGRQTYSAGGRLVRGLEAVLISASDDHGRSWQSLGELPFDSYEPILFVHENRLYQIITPNRNESARPSYFPRDGRGRIWVSASEDEGQTWTKPVEVFCGPDPYTSGGQTQMVVRNGQLYATVSNRYQKMAVMACDLALGPLNPAAWRVSEFVEMPIPQELVAGDFPENPGMRCVEGNVVEVGGRLLVLARAAINCFATSNIAALFEIHDHEQKLDLKFLQLYPLPGGQCKFYIVYDEPSQLYWMASNLPSNSQDLIGLRKSPEVADKVPPYRSLREDRRLLTLWYSLDALNWIPAGWIAKADGWAQSFMYPVVVIDGDDLGILCRTAQNSGDYHDADLATYHTVKNFRQYAVNLRPTF